MLIFSSLECSCQYEVKNGCWIGECCSEPGTPSTTPKSDTKEFFGGGYFRNATTCKWGKVAVMVWAGDCSNLRGWGGLMLWSFQHCNTYQGRVRPNRSVNMPAHDKGTFNSVYTLLY